VARRVAPRLARLALVAGALAAGAFAAGCGSSEALSMKNEACASVNKSLQLYDEAMRDSGARRANLLDEANVDLRDAVSPASLAASGDSQWQALEATVAVSARVTESDLVQALTDQCAPGSA
jgi:hypothetical protein